MPNNWEREWQPGGMFDLMPDAAVVVAKDGTISRVNGHLAAMFGYSREELVGAAVEILLPEAARAAHVGQRAAYDRQPRHRPIRNSLDLLGRRKDGTDFPVSIMLGPITGRGDDRTMAVVRDLAATEAMRRLLYTDQLTRLPNRAALYQDLGERFSARKPSAADTLALALFDLDGLHAVNSALGFAAGDDVLKSVARRLVMAAADFGKPYRLSGDKFVVLVSGVGDPLAQIASIRAMIDHIVEPLEVQGKSVAIGAWAGIVSDAGTRTDIDELLADADLALSRARAEGANRSAVFSPFMRAVLNVQRALEGEIEAAFKTGQLELFFQPQVRSSDLRVLGAEALLRWRHPARGIVPPADFFDVLLAGPLVPDVGLWVLRTACREAAEWRALGSEDTFVGVNLFQVQIADPALLRDVAAALAEVNLPARLLELEISENFTLENDETILRSLEALRAIGVGLALDDLGTGHASLTQIAKLPVSCLKIDQSFVRQMVPGGREALLVGALVKMAHGLDMQVVAEGVETEEQANILSGTSCDRAQGYFFGRPMPASDFRAMIARGVAPIRVAAAG